MSSTTVKPLKNETLRSLIEKVGKHNPEPAERLWQQATETADYQCLITNSVLHREGAIECLIELNPGHDVGQLSAYREVWPLVNSATTRVRIGRIVLDATCEKANHEYYRVAEFVPELRQEAIDGIVHAGAWWYRDLNAVWRWGDPAIRDQVWKRFLREKRDEDTIIGAYIKSIVLRGVEDLSERAWEAYKEDVIPDDLCLDTDIGTLLDHPDFAERVWEWLKSLPYQRGLMVKVMTKYPQFGSEALRIYAEHETKPFDLWCVLGFEDGPDHYVSAHLAEIQRQAAEMLWERQDLTEDDLECMLTHRPAVDEAVKRLLSGQFKD